MNNLLSSFSAAIGFAALAVVFVFALSDFQRSTIDWANRDLSARAGLAAAHLEEALRTQDMKLVHDFADDCRGKGYRLRILSSAGGVFFDSVAGSPADPKSNFSAAADVDGFRILLMLPSERVLEPYRRTLPLFALAALVGIAGMVFVFFAIYRQRAKIRELERIEKERMEFITDFTHQLKTPLTGMVGAVDMMGEDPLGRIVKDCAKRLDQLLMDLIAFHFGRPSKENP